MAKKQQLTRNKQKPSEKKYYNEHYKEFVKTLARRGKSLDSIATRLGMNKSTLRKWASEGKWKDEIYPEVALDDLFEEIKLLMHIALMRIHNNHDELYGEVRIALKDLSYIMRQIVEIAPLRKEALTALMKEIAEQVKDAEQAEALMKLCQGLYDGEMKVKIE